MQYINSKGKISLPTFPKKIVKDLNLKQNKSFHNCTINKKN